MSQNLAQIVAELFAKPADGAEQMSRVQQVGDEIRKVVQSGDTVFGKFRELLESFREIIPDEQQRYRAALKALSTTSKLSRQEIVKAISGQLDELKILEKGLMPAPLGWRDELKAMEARAQQVKGEMAQLRERIAQLENEERSIAAYLAAREKDLAFTEQTLRDLFATIGVELTALSKKVADLTAEGPAAPPVPPAVQPVPASVQPVPPSAQPVHPGEPLKDEVPGEEGAGAGQKIEFEAPPAQLDPKWQKKCPMCGGQLNLLVLENMWLCYTCAYEEPASDGPKGAGPAAALDDEDDEPEQRPATTAGQAPTKKKNCPVCRKKMFWYPDDKAWRCPSCNYERKI